MRFVYCAAAVCTMLNNWGKVNKDKMADYIIKSIVKYLITLKKFH